MIRRISLLLVAVALLAGATPVLKWLRIQRPFGVGVDEVNFCNVLLVGNLAAGLVALVTFRPRRIALELRAARKGTWGLLAINAAFAVAIPTLIFSALAYTSVTNVVLLGRFESVVFAVLSALVLRMPIATMPKVGYGVIVLGILGLVLFQTDWELMRGELYVLAAAFLQGVAALVSKRTLADVGLGLFVFFRNAVSALFFFIAGSIHFGLGHFAHAWGPGLWAMMLVYAAVVTVLGQLAWYRSIAVLPPAVVANGSMVAPVLGIFFAWLLLSEAPSGIQWLGAAIVFAGMLLTRLGPRPMEAPRPVESSLAGS